MEFKNNLLNHTPFRDRRFCSFMHAAPGMFSGGKTIGHIIPYTLMLDGSADYMHRTLTGAGDNPKKLTVFSWFKLSGLGVDQVIFEADDGAGNDELTIDVQSSDTLRVTYRTTSNTLRFEKVSDFKLRDTTGHYFVAVAIDTTPATPTFKVFCTNIRGSADLDVTSLMSGASTLAQNDETSIGQSGARYRWWASLTLGRYWDGLGAMSGILDGVAITDPVTDGLVKIDSNGAYVPGNVAGLTYGSEGSLCDYADADSLGKDVSGTVTQGGLKFDGGYASFTAETGVDSGSGPITMACWMKVSDWKVEPGYVDIGGLNLTTASGTGKLKVHDYAVAQTSENVASATLDTWIFATITHATGGAGPTNSQIFANGVLQSDTGGDAGTVSLSSTGYIGRNSNNDQIDGEIAHVMIWDEVLTAAELLELYNQGFAGVDPTANSGDYTSSSGLIHYFDCQETGGTTLNDTQNAANATLTGTYSFGNGNNFTPVSSPVQFTDTPTNNFATLDPNAAFQSGSSLTFYDGNTRMTSSGEGGVAATLAVNSGRWYWESTCVTQGSWGDYYGVISRDAAHPAYFYVHSYNDIPNSGPGSHSTDETGTWGLGSSLSNGDKVYFDMDLDAGTLKMKRNTGSWRLQLSGMTGYWSPMSYVNSGTNTQRFNFGQTPYSGGTETDENGYGLFDIAPPSGALALCTANLPAPAIADPSAHFQSTLYSGNGSTRTISQTGNSTFPPGLIWVKDRTGTSIHHLEDNVRGWGKFLSSDGTNSETTTNVHGQITAVADGSFDLTIGSSTFNYFNYNTYDYVAWQWKGDGTGGTTNSDGDINSTIEVNDTAGFSFGTVVLTGSTAEQYGHGQSGEPELVLFKPTSSAGAWNVYVDGITSTGERLVLNTTAAKASVANLWQTPTSSLLGVGTAFGADTYAFYAWRSIPGYSKIGTYTGNGSTDGPFVHCGFKPAWVLVKAYSRTGSWNCSDSTRSPYNVSAAMLQLDATAAEATTSWTYIDLLANGFKIRGSDTSTNGSTETYIFMAFAECPFGGDGVAQGLAR
jgi:hypothetical protein